MGKDMAIFGQRTYSVKWLPCLNYVLISNLNKITMQQTNQNILFTILHFNDVYDIQPNKKGKYGVVSFEAYLRKLKNQYPNHLVLFSGDAFSPSILSNIFEGRQMVKALNKLGIDVAQYGNHQFDYEPEVTEKLARSCNFPWLLGNIYYRDTNTLLGNGQPYAIKQCNGVKVGIYGVAGEDWMGILNDDYQNLLEYEDVGEHSQKMCQLLKDDHKCDFIVALTHMRVPQDQKLPLDAPITDIVLGGHDHIIMKDFINGIPVLKSGDNFKTLGIISVYNKGTNQNAAYKGQRFDFDIRIQEVPAAAQEEIDKQLKQHVQSSMEKYMKSDHIVGYTMVPLDTRFGHVRTRQTNYGNFLADLSRAYYDADCCILNSGSIRNDLMIPPGELRYSIISNIINSVLVVKEVPGSVLLQALQFSCEGLPTVLSGKFLCVSGIKFTYNTNLKPMIQSVQVRGYPLKFQQNYSVVTQLYIGMGGDGYQMLKNCRFIVDQIAGIDLLRLILRFFKGVQNLTQCQQQKKLLESKDNNQQDVDIFPLQMLKMCRKISSKMSRISSMRKKFIVDSKGQKYVCISPVTQGRIVCLNK